MLCLPTSGDYHVITVADGESIERKISEVTDGARVRRGAPVVIGTVGEKTRLLVRTVSPEMDRAEEDLAHSCFEHFITTLSLLARKKP